MKARDLNLAEILESSGGQMALHGQRIIMHDLASLGQFRKDLIETVGAEQARRLLTRKGFFWGQSMAAAMKRCHEWDSLLEWLQAGTALAGLCGLGEAELRAHELDTARGRFDLEIAWRDSPEVAQHLQEMGEASAPVCWALAGYASGYFSFCLGRSVYFVETHCQASGSPCCVAIGRDPASWGNAIDPLLKFFEADDLQSRIQLLTDRLEQRDLELARRPKSIPPRKPSRNLYPVEVRSPAFKHTLDLAERVARFDTTVLVTGETGVGKEVLARYMHQASPRCAQPLLAVNCSAFPENLLESELFGHRAGAFTGANENRPGLFEEAHGGTVFLDEIGDISASMQAKLLRVLQEREIKRIGETRPRRVDVRIISATNKQLDKLVGSGAFREDLYFRLKVVHISIPPLRERLEDILPLARHFLAQCARRHRLPNLRLAPASLDLLTRHPWPGNVRELENVVEQAAVLSGGGVLGPDLFPMLRTAVASDFASSPSSPSRPTSPTPTHRTLAELEQAHLERVLMANGGNRARTAQILGIGQATLYRRLRALRAKTGSPTLTSPVDTTGAPGIID